MAFNTLFWYQPIMPVFVGSWQMAIQIIFLGSDLDSAHRVSMKAPIFKPFDNTIGNAMTIFVPKPNYFIQYWRVQNLDFRLYPCDPFSGQPSQLHFFFADTGSNAASACSLHNRICEAC